MKESIVDEANAIKIFNFITENKSVETFKCGDYFYERIFGAVLEEAGMLGYVSGGISFALGTRFSFNYSSSKSLQNYEGAFEYNALASFFNDYEIEDIRDHRFTGYYRFTQQMLKKKHRIDFENWCNENSSVTISEIKWFLKKALIKMRDDSFAFDVEYNQVSDETRSEFAKKTDAINLL